MNILLLAPSYFGLYLPVKDALEKKGHNVTWIDDVSLKYPYKRKDKTIFHRLARKIVSKVLKVEKRFWDSQKHILDKQTYDLFLVINGCCYCPYVKELLKRNNKTIKLVQYAWDANKYYDFFHYNKNHIYNGAKIFEKSLQFSFLCCIIKNCINMLSHQGEKQNEKKTCSFSSNGRRGLYAQQSRQRGTRRKHPRARYAG